MKKNMYITSYNNTKANIFVRGCFVLFLIMTLFAPTSVLIAPQFASVDSVGNVRASDWSDGVDIGYGENSADYANIDFSVPSFNVGVDTPVQLEAAPQPIALPSYDDYTDYAGSYNSTLSNTSFYGTNTMWGDSGADITGEQGGNGGSDMFNVVGGDQSTTFNTVGGDQATEFNTVGGDQGTSFNTVGGDQGTTFNTVGGDQGTTFNTVGGDETTDFPWWALALGLIPLIHSGSNSNTLAATPIALPITPTTTPTCVAVTMASTASASGIVGTAFTYSVSGSGTAPITYTVGTLPSGLTFSGGTISGTPTTAGTFTVTVTATNACGTATQTLTITIAPLGGSCVPGAPSINSVTAMSVAPNASVSYTITANGNPTSYNATNLPAGLSVSTSTGVISGTIASAGTYTINLTATNNCGTGTGQLVITVTTPTGGGGGGGGGGGTPSPTVSVSSIGGGGTIGGPSVYLARTPYAGLYLNQVPYTGLGDIAVSILFIVILLLVSAFLSYVSVYGEDFAPLRAFTAKYALLISVLRKKASAKVATYVTRGVQATSAKTLKEAAPALETNLNVVLPVVQEIPKVVLDTLVLFAREKEALLKEDAAALIYNVAEGHIETATRLLTHVIAVLQGELKEDTLAILTLTKVKKLLAETYVSLAQSYVTLLNNGEHKKAEAFLMKLQLLEADVYAFLLKVERLKEAQMAKQHMHIAQFA